MKILKYLLFLILLIFIGSAIYFGTKEGSYTIEDTILVSAPQEVVFNKVNNLKSWEEWGPWKKEGAVRTISYAEKTSGEGASLSWKGKEEGSITTVKVLPYKEIDQEMTFSSAMGKSNAHIHWNFEKIDGGTQVTWSITGEHSLMDKIYLSLRDFDFDNSLHEKISAALASLSQTITDDMKRYSIHVDGVTQYGGGYYMYTTSVAKQSELDKKTAPMMKVVMDFVTNNRLNMAGNPFTLFNEIDDTNGNVIFSVGVPIKEKVITPEGSPVVCGFMSPVTTVKATLKGNYENLPETYTKARQYMEQNDIQADPNGDLFEVYITDPEEVPNPADWVTEIYIPIVETGKSEFDIMQ